MLSLAIGFFVLFSCVCAQTTDYMSLPQIPGVDFVGFGYDARFDDARTALQIPLHSYSYTQQKVYTYPANPSVTYRVPDEIVVRTVALTEAESYLYSSLDELTNSWALDLGINFGQSSSQNTSAQTCVQNLQTNTTTCQTTDTTNKTSLFSVGTTFSYAQNTLESESVYIVTNSEKTQLFNVFLNTQPIRHEVKQYLTTLAASNLGDAAQTYFKFLERYGTHYVVSAVMGGRVMSTSNIQTTTTQSTTTVGANATVTQVSTQEAMNAATAMFSSSLNAEIDFSLQNANSQLESTSSSSWMLLGGDPSVVNLLDASTSAAAILQWKGTIYSNPVAVGYRLRSISTLIEDLNCRAAMEAAIAVYLSTYSTDGIISVVNTNTN